MCFDIAVDEDDCAGSPCHHGATCIDRVAGYECRCPGEFFGVNCQLGKLSTVEPLTQGFPNWGTRNPGVRRKVYSRGYAESGGTVSKAMPRIEALAGYMQVHPYPINLSIIVICIIK